MFVTSNPAIARIEWARHWKVPFACAAASAVSVTHLNTIGVLLPAIRQEYGWPVAQITGGLTIISLMALVFSGFVGAAVDRFGSRVIGLIGLSFFCLMYAMLSATGGLITSWWTHWFFIGIGYVCITTTVWTPIIAQCFRYGRGLAIAVMLSGNGIAQISLPYITTLLVEQYGWRGACVGVALIEAAVALPIVWLFARNSLNASATAEHQLAQTFTQTGQTFTQTGLTLGKAVRSSQYIKIAISALIFTTGLTALFVHFIPILREGGAEARAAATIAGSIGIAVIVGRLSTGALLDRLQRPWIGGVAFALPVSTCLLLLFHPSQNLAFVAAVLFGLGFGSELDVIVYSSTRYFGLRHLGAILGTLVGLIAFGAGVGPLFGGIMFDVFAGYDGLIKCVLPMFLISAALMASLGPYPSFNATGQNN